MLISKRAQWFKVPSFVQDNSWRNESLISIKNRLEFWKQECAEINLFNAQKEIEVRAKQKEILDQIKILYGKKSDVYRDSLGMFYFYGYPVYNTEIITEYLKKWNVEI